MNWSTSVLTSISSDTEPTIVVAFDNAKYIFNVGENTNRAFLQSRYNWKRTKGLFLTQLGTQRAGGLGGLMMTLADGGISSLDVVGPTGLLHQLASMRMYTYRDTLHIQPIEAPSIPLSSPEPIYKDDNITVYGIPIAPSVLAQGDALGDSPLKQKRKRSPSPHRTLKRASIAKADSSLPTTTLEQISSQLGFSPSSLSGDLAQEWKTSLVKVMFPASKKHETKIAKEKGNERDETRKKGKPTAAIVEEHDLPEPDLEPGTENIDIYKRAKVPDGYHLQLPPFSYPGAGSSDSPPTLAYLVIGPRIRGKFDAKKAGQLGIPNGPIRRRLINGETVKFMVKSKQMEDGVLRDVEVEREVKPEDCVGESETPAVILILDIPSPMYIPSLLSSFSDPFFAKFKSRCPEDKKDHVMRAVFHILGDGVLEDERYVQFMNSFEDDEGPVHHLVASREHCSDPVTFTSAAFNQLRLNQLDESMFPIPQFSLQPRKDMSSIPHLPQSAQIMVTNHSISMRPFKAPSVETPVQDCFHPAIKAEKQVLLPPWTAKKFEAAKRSIEAARRRRRRRRSVGSVESDAESGSESSGSSTVRSRPGRDVGILPLGTGSAMPTKYRNVSSTLISIPNWGNVLLDAGEGTWGQLVRQFGLGNGSKGASSGNDIWQVLRDLKCIFISHIHADHHMGLATLLAKRRLLDPPPKDPLYLVSIRAVHLYLRELSDVQNLGIVDTEGTESGLPGSSVVPIMSEALHWKQFDTYQASGMWQIGGSESWLDIQRSRRLAHSMCQSLGLDAFQTVDMYHRTRCYGAVLKHTDGWSIAFSGDTLPVNTLVQAGKDATVLIHEATMAGDQEDLAKSKAHSTFGQAIATGKRMNAEHTLLTHFSARYPKMPPSSVLAGPDPGEDVTEGAGSRPYTRRKRNPVVAVAFDHLNLTIGSMWKVMHYLPAVEQSFHDTVEDGDELEPV
ncbi:hypothetical protein JOM56_007717 [Amanita muscaria]